MLGFQLDLPTPYRYSLNLPLDWLTIELFEFHCYARLLATRR